MNRFTSISLVALGATLILTAALHGHGDDDHKHEGDDGHAHPKAKPTEFNHVTPILNVASVEDSINYYTQKLGFKKDWDWPDAPNKTFASISCGSVNVFLAEGNQGGAGVWTYYNVADIDALHKQYVKAGAKVTKAPKDHSWGMREMLVEDIDGHVLRIGQPLPHDAAEPPI